MILRTFSFWGGRNKKEWVNLGLQVKCDTDPANFDTKVLQTKFVPKRPVLPPSRKPD